MKKRLLSGILTVCMTWTLIPNAWAADTEQQVEQPDVSVAVTEDKIDTQEKLLAALAAASTGDEKTVTLDGNITVSDAGLSKNMAAVTVPSGVTLDGAGFTITAENWENTNANHVFAIENAVEKTTIKNLTIVGNEKTKSGIHTYLSTDVVLEEVTIQNCGNVGLLVNGSKVSATGLKTSGNVWGAVNVDREGASFTLDETSVLKEEYKVWTELTVSEETPVITVPDSWEAKEMVSADGKTYYADKALIDIDGTPYPTLRDAALHAQSGDTILLHGNVTVTNNGISLDETAALVTLPDGVTLDGQGYTVSANANWNAAEAGNPKNPILGTDSAVTGAAIKDVTVIGNQNTKHGINAWTSGGEPGKLTLTDVTVKNCGTAALVVANTQVTADGLTTSGNAWGAVNVGSQGTSQLTLKNVTMEEDVQVWTELTQVPEGTIVIEDAGFTQVASGGSAEDESGLKGYTYFTDDMTKLGNSAITAEDGSVTVFETLAQAAASAHEGDTIVLLKDVETATAIEITAPGVTIDGKKKAIRYVGEEEVAGGSLIMVKDGGNSAVIEDVTIETNGKAKYGVQFYCVEDGQLSGVIVNGGSYAPVLVNGAKVTVENTLLNPDTDANGNIEYGVGSGVTTMPEIVLDNVTGDPDTPLIYVDVEQIKENNSGLADASIEEIVEAINKNLTGTALDVDEDGEIVAPKNYTITFDANGGTVDVESAVTNNEGKLASLPTPERSGKYDFEGWFTKKEDGKKVTLNTVFEQNMTIYAQWEYTGNNNNNNNNSNNNNNNSGSNGGNQIIISGGQSMSFADVKAGQWYYDAVKYVYQKKLMAGTSTTTFAPDETTTRGMIVTILHRLDGQPAAPVSNFDDVAAGQYYANAVSWASAKGIVQGYGDGRFGPDDTITRQQMAAILYRYAQSKGYSVTASADLSSFADADMVHDYAADAVRWAVATGMITGTDNATLHPSGSATRAQIAAILMRFCETVAK